MDIPLPGAGGALRYRVGPVLYGLGAGVAAGAAGGALCAAVTVWMLVLGSVLGATIRPGPGPWSWAAMPLVLMYQFIFSIWGAGIGAVLGALPGLVAALLAGERPSPAWRRALVVFGALLGMVAMAIFLVAFLQEAGGDPWFWGSFVLGGLVGGVVGARLWLVLWLAIARPDEDIPGLPRSPD